MKAFAELYSTLDATTSTRDKLDALTAYFRRAPAADAAWAAYFLAGGKPRQTVPTKALRALARTMAGLPEWLFDECYQAVGDLAETIAHILPPPLHAPCEHEVGLAIWVEDRLIGLRGLDSETLNARLSGYWNELDSAGRFLLTKLIGGGFRVGVSRQLVVRALAEVAGIDHKRIAHRMIGWTDSKRTPTAARFAALIAADVVVQAGPQITPQNVAGDKPDISAEVSGSAINRTDDTVPEVAQHDDIGLPYPFFLAHPLQHDPATLGDRDDWQVEWKWDGIRAQLVKRAGSMWLWSRGEDLITDRFPDVLEAAAGLPDGTVLDGEILAWIDGADHPLPFAQLQPRIARKTLTRKILADSPARFLVYDLLEVNGSDIRSEPQHQRRRKLEAILIRPTDLLNDAPRPLQASLTVSPLVDATSWERLATLRSESRERGVEGFMLKRRNAHYGVGRTRTHGEWLKWKIEPYTVDAVLLYAQHGHGRRANLYTDYTFAVWSGDANDPNRTLVPFTKAYSGLSDEEIKRVDAIVRQTTIEKFGPVRSVQPTLLFEIAFEGIARSPRHKSGIAVRFPRMLRWRQDKPIDEADTINALNTLLDGVPSRIPDDTSPPPRDTPQ